MKGINIYVLICNLSCAAAAADLISPSKSSSFNYPSYCAKVDSKLPALRSIPPLSQEGQDLISQLIQVQALVRHGARAPASKFNCWANYTPKWNCGLDQVVQGHISEKVPLSNDRFTGQSEGVLYVEDHLYAAAEDTADDLNDDDDSSSSSLTPTWVNKLLQAIQGTDSQGSIGRSTRYYEKLYDADARDNVLGGTCQKGQLLAEGFQQHQMIGRLLANAYLDSNEKKQRVPIESASPLLTSDNFRNEIYFRASDMQRTILSGSALLTSFLRSVSDTPVGSDAIPVHTMDLEREYVFPNLVICPGLRKVREDIFASSGYADLRTKYSALEQKIRLAVGRDDISDVWPGEFFDCIMTTLCTGQVDQLPPGLRPEVTISQDSPLGPVEEVSLLNYTFAAVDDYATFEYTWENSLFSKTAMAKLYIEVKTEMLRAMTRDLADNGHLESVDDIISNITGHAQYQEFSALIIKHHRFKTQDHTNPWDAKKLVLYAGHDTSIMPFLAALEGSVFDKKWPPYASEVVIELYRGTKPEEYMFRLIYNGAALTSEIPGCTEPLGGARDLCLVSSLFATTPWATPSGALGLCDGPGVSTPAPVTERWLLRRSVPEQKAVK